MEHGLSAGVGQVAGHWRLGDLTELVAGYWNPAPLPPALRHRMGEVADRILAIAKDLPAASRSDAYRLIAHLYRGAGLGSKATAAADRAGDRELAAFFAADLRYRSDP